MANRYKGHSIAAGIAGLLSGIMEGKKYRRELEDKVAERELEKMKIDADKVARDKKEKEDAAQADFENTLKLWQTGQGKNFFDFATGKTTTTPGASPDQLRFMASRAPRPLDVSGFGIVPPKSTVPTPPPPRVDDPAVDIAKKQVNEILGFDPETLQAGDVETFKNSAKIAGLEPEVTETKPGKIRAFFGAKPKYSLGIKGRSALGPDMPSPAAPTTPATAVPKAIAKPQAPAQPEIPAHIQELAKQLQEKYKTPEDVAKDYHAGKISKETAVKILELLGVK